MSMLHFIFNPRAGRGTATRARAVIEPMLRDIPHAFHETFQEKHAVALTRALRPDGDTLDVVAMGGDGSLHEVLNGLADPARTRLGLIPCGSGNDFASAAGIPSDPAAALRLILEGRAKYTDYMECSGVRGINAIGTGIDVDILRRYARMKVLRGSLAYLFSLITTVMTYVPRRFRDVTGTAPVSHEAFIACAGNGRSFGGGIPICPEAVVDDGLLDVVIVDGIRKSAIPAAFLKLMRGRVADLPTAQTDRRPALKIASDSPMPVQIDGEIYEDLPFDVRVVHDVLRVYRP